MNPEPRFLFLVLYPHCKIKIATFFPTSQFCLYLAVTGIQDCRYHEDVGTSGQVLRVSAGLKVVFGIFCLFFFDTPNDWIQLTLSYHLNAPLFGTYPYGLFDQMGNGAN